MVGTLRICYSEVCAMTKFEVKVVRDEVEDQRHETKEGSYFLFEA
jgi:hypothetical protein